MKGEGTRPAERRLEFVVSGAAATVVLAAAVVGGGTAALRLLPGVASIAVAAAALARVLASSGSDDRRLAAVWTAAGTLVAGALALWIRTIDALAPGADAELVVGTLLVAGAASGATVGAVTVRSRRREREQRAAAERHRETVSLLNRILRHHLLNGLNVVEGHAKLLEERVDGAGTRNLEAIRSRTDRMTETVQCLRQITTRLADPADPEPVALSPILESELERARTLYRSATFSAPEVPAGHEVLADETLSLAVANVLANAVQHNDAPSPRIDVSVEVDDETTLVTVADNGPGVPDALEAEVFDASVRGEGSAGDGLGLFLSSTIVDDYGGEVTVDDDDALGGAAFTLSLPTA